MSFMKAVSVPGPDSITSKPLESDGVNSAPEPEDSEEEELVAGGNGSTVSYKKRQYSPDKANRAPMST